MKITLAAGVRPNLIKIAPIIHAIQRQQDLGVDIQFRFVHTGQHYDALMSTAFLNS